MAFALQMRKKHGKTSVRVVEECCYVPGYCSCGGFQYIR